MQGLVGCDGFMNICCPRCGGLAEPAGHEDARAFFQCPTCSRVWATHISAPATRSLPSATAPRVLIADDSPEMLGLLTAWLEDEGCVVITASSGREAIDAGDSYKPDLAFVDVVLPPPDGFHVCDVLTRRMGFAVVLMTGMSSPDSRRVEEAGALLLLKKPFEREAMIDALTLGLEQCRRRQGASGGTAFASR
jgi:CheY-like chemotaxis protein